jgi:hypothetical protein
MKIQIKIPQWQCRQSDEVLCFIFGALLSPFLWQTRQLSSERFSIAWGTCGAFEQELQRMMLPAMIRKRIPACSRLFIKSPPSKRLRDVRIVKGNYGAGEIHLKKDD